MKKIIIFILLLLPVLACSQERFDSPQTISWDGESDIHEVAIQMGTDEIIILGETSELEYYIDLQALEIYGEYAVMVRGVQYTDPDLVDYSDWLRSDNPEHVIIVDGVPMMFTLVSKQPAKMPNMMWIKIGE